MDDEESVCHLQCWIACARYSSSCIGLLELCLHGLGKPGSTILLQGTGGSV